MSAHFQQIALPTTLTDLLEARENALRLLGQARQIIDRAEKDLKQYGHYLMPGAGKMNGSLELATHQLDRAMWRQAFDLTGFRQLMDTKAINDFERGLEHKPPAFTEENIRSTFVSVYQEKDAIFRRGIVNVFRGLSKDYRTNEAEPFRIGEKVIVDWMVTCDGWRGLHIRYGAAERLDDIDRVFKTLAGEKFHPRSLETAVNAAWAEGNLYEDDYYRIRGFKKGSMHIQFKRADLLEKVNDLIAEHYGSNALAAA